MPDEDTIVWKWFWIFCGMAAFSIAIGSSATSYTDSIKEVKAYEAGLQQCQEVSPRGFSIIVYKKECK